MPSAQQYLKQLNQDYLTVHRQKEDLFWSTYMATSNDHDGSAAAETKWIQFISDASRIEELRQQIASLEDNSDSETLHGLNGWLALFEANALESKEAQELKAQLIKVESALYEKKQKYSMVFEDKTGKKETGTLPTLASNIKASDDPVVRQSSHQAFLDLEQWLLNNGFIELVKLRNRFARSLGKDNFFDYSIEITEKMTSDQLFSILDDFEKRTAKTNLNSLKNLKTEKGDDALLPYNFFYSFAGDAVRDLDPYVPFSSSLRRWVESFSRLNIDYADAELTLDLLDREGKYQNGFCHGPIPSFYDEGQWVPAKVNFTSNAKPDQVGSGYSGINTLFHEGGHAAHFANVAQNAPCFSQEFAPTSMAYAETQSMFCDSLLSDADWLKQYAKNKEGEPVPDQIIKAFLSNKQPFFAYSERSILVVPYFERALYKLSDDELTAENITKLARELEVKILGIESPRPLMAIPHLLSNESACSYQGYLLAHMAVYQTRAYFTEKFGYLCDNPEIGPLLKEHYWKPGNSLSHDETIQSLCGEGFNAKYLADECNRSVDETWAIEQEKIKALQTRQQSPLSPLNASIKVVDGDRILASNENSLDEMCTQFESIINSEYR